MKQEITLEPSEDLAYWVGVSQADGYLKRYYWKTEKRVGVDFGIGENSLPMMKKFREISKRVFDRQITLWKDKKGYWRYYISIKSFLRQLRELQIIFSPIYLPPIWTISEKKYFGAYLAGLIDGDGDIRVKRPKYPQCVIRITSGLMQDFLRKTNRNSSGCKNTTD